MNNTYHDDSGMFVKIDPYPEPVILSNLLGEISSIVKNCVVLSNEEANAIALWVIFSYCMDAANFAPILNITSPEKRCGKSTLAALLTRLVYRPIAVSNITVAALFRSIEKWSPTLIIDEGDSFVGLNEELRGILNSGHSKDLAYTIRCVGKNHEPTRFKTWCAKVIVGIGSLPDTVTDRSIVIQLKRKLVEDEVKNFRNYPASEIKILVSKCMRFREDSLTQLEQLNVTMPQSLSDRAANNWEPLFAIAYLAGEEWTQYVHEAAVYLSKTANESISTSVELLRDIKNIFYERHFEGMYTCELIKALCDDIEAPWLTYDRGKPLSARQLAQQLKEFGIRSKDMRLPPRNQNWKGYLLQDFQEAFTRYIPS